MNDNETFIAELTVVKELVKRVENVFAERLKLESPFVSALTACIRAFLFARKISGFKLSFPDSLSRVDKKSKPNLERVKEFSPFTDFFSSSTVMPQRDLTGQDYLLITLPMISKIFTSYMVSQERKR